MLEGAVESGVTFLDTADVYGDGRSETQVAAVYDELVRPHVHDRW